MYCAKKLKYAMTVALSVTFAGFSSSPFALGLGDINVHSSLGEPLKASITVLGAQDLASASCLKLGNDSDLRQVDFILTPFNGHTAQLTLTSNSIVNEPIVNLSVVAGCDNSIARHYVLLLDPPFSNNTLKPSNSPAKNLSADQGLSENTNNQNAKSATPKSAVQKVTASAKKISKKKETQRKTTKANQQTARDTQPNGDKISSVNTDSDTNNLVNATNDEPRLSISGGSYLPSLNDTGLRLDKSLNLDPNAYGPFVPPTAEEVLLEDEMTVVNNRILHLQKQINQLQVQNTKLSSDNQSKSTQLAETKSKQTTLRNLLLFICALLLLLLAYIAFTWLRRRQLETQANNAKALWTNTKKNSAKLNPQLASAEAESVTDDDDGNNNEITQEVIDDDTLPPAPIASIFKSEDEAQPIVIEDDPAFSVLDHADVFLFHGRASLAIQLLQNYLIEHPKQSITIWLFLLDLLAKENSKDLYQQTAADCKLYYNIKIPDFSQSQADTMESLEDFPRLAQGLTTVWGTPNALIYLDDLIYNNRLTPRAGLPKSLIEELSLLKGIAQENSNPAEVPALDEKKLAEIKEKEAMLENIKLAKLEAMAKAESLMNEKVEAEKKETSFEFTLIDK